MEAKYAEVGKWDRWARAVLGNENVRKTFNYEVEARKALERVRKIREAGRLSNTSNGTKV